MVWVLLWRGIRLDQNLDFEYLFNLCTCWANLLTIKSIKVNIIIIILRTVVKIKEDHDRCNVLSMASVHRTGHATTTL